MEIESLGVDLDLSGFADFEFLAIEVLVFEAFTLEGVITQDD